MSFEDLGLEPTILKAIAEAGYETPTPIQKAAVPEALKGRDVLGIAQTGTGKTAAFTLPMIQRLAKGRARARMPRTLVLEPTRELAAQVAENFEKYGKYHKLSMALLIGGVSFGDQDAKLTRGVDVLIATPGRLLDHFERGRLLLTGIEVMVVDEADRMLDMGFIPDIERIFKLTPITRQTLFFSATMPPEIQRITDAFLHEPARVEVSRPASTASTITQKIVRLDNKADNVKRAALRQLLEQAEVRNGIIFCNRKSTVDIVAKSLQSHGYNARPIHGDLAQSFRTETLDKFRSGELKFLVASDVAARGLDIPDVSHVFNFDVPIHAEDYVHRIGRTGRAGKSGATFMLVTPADGKHYDSILKTIGSDSIEELSITVDVEPRERERSGGRERGGNRDRSGGRGRERGRRSDREARPRVERAPAEAAETVAAPLAESSEAPRQNRPSGEARQRPDRPSRDRNPRRRDEPAEKVVGLGDHTPAFLLR
ncbi:MAG: DEAD/DEAH box helicase [Pseudomonadota bacterium]|nr:DEAD/DEAH box helicase [Pseudomonadota bacterium]